jgi:single-stranded DNA-binding protein
LRISSYSDDEAKETKWFTEVVASSVQFLGSRPQQATGEPTAPPEATSPGEESQFPEEEVPF